MTLPQQDTYPLAYLGPIEPCAQCGQSGEVHYTDPAGGEVLEPFPCPDEQSYAPGPCAYCPTITTLRTEVAGGALVCKTCWEQICYGED